ncbi:hypothetical protein [Nonomuraea basaltis]|uniref:hypothetical protein n=1 Tax=Nonomuraea basaltis TaxID=2495887 RepID=UPI00110C6F36|nr:hypothetical protein [Nonomuraea basaltis]TMR97872.1 hypothetical protein EJK15_16135 [Nonomuraea basaltis]
MIVSLHRSGRARSTLLLLLTITATIHLLLCGFGPHAHAGLPSGHHQHVSHEGDAPADHGGDGDHHATSCDDPATQPAPVTAAPPSMKVATAMPQRPDESKASAPAAGMPRSGTALLTTVCVSRV